MTDRDDTDLRNWASRAFDDEPTAASPAADLDRGHAALSRRRRWTTGVSGVAVAAVAFAIAVAPSLRDAVPSGEGELPPASGGAGNDDRPRLSAVDRALLDDCEGAARNVEVTIVEHGIDADTNVAESKPGPKPDLGDWSVVDRVDDDWGTTAILLSADESTWATCTVGFHTDFFRQMVRTPQRVPQGFVQQPDGTYDWKGGDTVSWAQQCVKSGNDCGRDLYYLTTRVPVGVDSITMKTYDGVTTEARITDGFALIRTLGPVLNDYPGTLPGSSTTPPIILTYRAQDGEVLSRYNSEFLPPIPDGECEGSGGC
jgi:hypothetical protein